VAGVKLAVEAGDLSNLACTPGRLTVETFHLVMPM